MKKILLYTTICFLLLGFIIPNSFVFAQEIPTPPPSAPASLPPPINKTLGQPDIKTPSATPPSADSTFLDYLKAKQDAYIAKQKASGCNLINAIGAGDFWSCTFSFIGYTLLKTMAWLIWLSGIILNYVLETTILKMTGNIGEMKGINIAWKVIRDLLNIGFIFLLVWEGLKMIMGLKNNAKGFIVSIIMASLLINFSLFFTKVIIDASNIATIGFYNSIVPDIPAGGAPTPGQPQSAYGRGLSTAFAKVLGISEFYSAEGISNLNQQGGTDSSNILIISLMGSVLFLVVSFVFLAISVMFIVRYIALIVLLILSPIAYFGLAYSGMSKYSKQWWSTLMGQCLFAPVYMIMTWVIITLMTSGGFTTAGGGAITNLVSGGGKGFADTTAIQLIFNYIIVIGLVIVSLTTAKGFAKQGATQIADMTGKLTSFAGGALMGSAAALGRNTIGATANSIANDQNLKDRAAAGDKRAQLMLKTARYGASASFDVRRNYLGEKIQEYTGTKFGKGTIFDEKAGKDGYKKKVEDKADKEKKYIDSLKPTEVETEKRKAEAQAKDAALVESSEEKKDLDKAKTEVQDKEVEIAKLNAEKRALEEKRQAASFKEEKRAIEGEINALNRRIGAEMENSEALKKLMENREKALKKFIETNKPNEKALDEEQKKRAEAYAKSLDDKATLAGESILARMWYGNPQLNQAAAAKIRVLNKKKSGKDKAVEALKALTEDGDITAPETPAPETPAAPTPEPPASPTT